jgi:hypothetical protein
MIPKFAIHWYWQGMQLRLNTETKDLTPQICRNQSDIGQSDQGSMTGQQTQEMQYGESILQSASTSLYVRCPCCRNRFTFIVVYPGYVQPYNENGAQHHPVYSNSTQQPPAQPTPSYYENGAQYHPVYSNSTQQPAAQSIQPYYASWYNPVYPSSTQQPSVQSTQPYYASWYNPAYPSSTQQPSVQSTQSYYAGWYYPAYPSYAQQPPVQSTQSYYAGWYYQAYPSSAQQPPVQSTQSYYADWYYPAYPSSAQHPPVQSTETYYAGNPAYPNFTQHPSIVYTQPSNASGNLYSPAYSVGYMQPISQELMQYGASTSQPWQHPSQFIPYMQPMLARTDAPA